MWEIKKAKWKNQKIYIYKKGTPGYKKVLDLFNNLSDKVFTDKTLKSQENEKLESRKEENEDYSNEDEDYESEN